MLVTGNVRTVDPGLVRALGNATLVAKGDPLPVENALRTLSRRLSRSRRADGHCSWSDQSETRHHPQLPQRSTTPSAQPPGPSERPFVVRPEPNRDR